MEEDDGNFVCPECNEKFLKITHSLPLGPDYRSDERLLQIIKCEGCNFEGVAIFEESRRGGLDSESWSHTGYKISKELLKKVMKTIDAKETNVDLSSVTSDEFFNMIL